MEMWMMLMCMGMMYIYEKEPMYSMMWFVSLLMMMMMNMSVWKNEYLMFFTYMMMMMYLSALMMLFSFVMLLSNTKKEMEKSNKYMLGMMMSMMSMMMWNKNKEMNMNEYESMMKMWGDNENMLNKMGSKMYTENKYMYSLVLMTMLLLMGLMGSLMMLK